jgi:hypothetical protein
VGGVTVAVSIPYAAVSNAAGKFRAQVASAVDALN